MPNPEVEFSIKNLESNLKRAPCLCKIIGYDYIIKKALLNQEKGHLGIIAKTFGIPNHIYQCYLESLFRTIKFYRIKYPNPTRKLKEDLLNPSKDIPTLAEIEVAAKLAPYFKITPEYPIFQSKSNLDLLIEDKNSGEKALIEVATSLYDYESHKYPNREAQIRFPGGKGSKGNKIKNALDKKLEKQLKNLKNAVISGQIPLEYPLIILFNIETPFDINHVFNKGEIELGLYENEFTLKDDYGNIGYRQVGFFRAENIEFISKIGIYKLQFGENYRTARKFYEPFKTPQQEMSLGFQLIFNDYYKLFGRFYEPDKTPQRKMSLEFEQKLENVLFDCTI
jgi:hypothetical protein